MFRTVVSQIMEAPGTFAVPAADVNALARIQQTGAADVVFLRPTRRAVQVLGILRKLASSPVRRGEEDGNGEHRSGENDDFALEQRLPDLRITSSAIRPAPFTPGKG